MKDGMVIHLRENVESDDPWAKRSFICAKWKYKDKRYGQFDEFDEEDVSEEQIKAFFERVNAWRREYQPED